MAPIYRPNPGGTPTGTATPVTGSGPNGANTPADVMARITQAYRSGIPLPPGVEIGPDGQARFTESAGAHFADIAQWAVPLGIGVTSLGFAIAAAPAAGGGAAAADAALPSTAISPVGALPAAAGGIGAGEGAADAGLAALPSTAISPVGALPTATTGISAGPTAGKFFSDLAKISGDASQIGGAGAAAAGAGRAQQAGIQQAQDRNAISLYNDQFQNNLRAPSTLASQAARGDLLQNLQSAQFSNLPSWIASQMPTMSGGLTPAALGPNARNAGAALSRNALLQLASNQFGLPKPPTLTPLPTPSTGDQINADIGKIGPYVSLASDAYKMFGGG